MVDPGEKDVTIKIPARDLRRRASRSTHNLPAPVNIVPKDAASAGRRLIAASAPCAAPADERHDPTDPAASASRVKTVDVGGGE